MKACRTAMLAREKKKVHQQVEKLLVSSLARTERGLWGGVSTAATSKPGGEANCACLKSHHQKIREKANRESDLITSCKGLLTLMFFFF
jgi:hypothetical protein